MPHPPLAGPPAAIAIHPLRGTVSCRREQKARKTLLLPSLCHYVQSPTCSGNGEVELPAEEAWQGDVEFCPCRRWGLMRGREC